MAITAVELLQIQTDFASVVCDTACVIKRKTLTKNGSGQASSTLNVVSPGDLMVGLTEPTGTQLQNYDYIVGSYATWQARFPFGTDVQAQDFLLVNGLTLTVQVILSPVSYAGGVITLVSDVKQ